MRHVDVEFKRWTAYGSGKAVTKSPEERAVDQRNRGAERSRQAQLSEERRLQNLVERQEITPEQREEMELKMRGPIGSAARYRRHLRELESMPQVTIS